MSIFPVMLFADFSPKSVVQRTLDVVSNGRLLSGSWNSLSNDRDWADCVEEVGLAVAVMS
jgi:hypothetical protein